MPQYDVNAQYALVYRSANEILDIFDRISNCLATLHEILSGQGDAEAPPTSIEDHLTAIRANLAAIWDHMAATEAYLSYFEDFMMAFAGRLTTVENFFSNLFPNLTAGGSITIEERQMMLQVRLHNYSSCRHAQLLYPPGLNLSQLPATSAALQEFSSVSPTLPASRYRFGPASTPRIRLRWGP
ncbi:hypothetical protein DRE_01354 [Drechslerella stenobrocha 248]|uniref:Uncharacterized protein n=1 Tax=Drechslerella stenobrocha 248 TaxID=1043628 RepID=W7HVC8_9PEZI|nr:hypothetical protein DRE_01354 [Drechslerella stenobrocha 248]